jgi:predicted DNA-binding transcriptional regulator AlpA
MKTDWVKIPLMAKELGVTTKTIYNWISVGKLFMPKPGYVSQVEAYEVWLQQKQLRVIQSYFLSKDITRNIFGKFSADKTSEPKEP